jgi:hypothetical protein
VSEVEELREVIREAHGVIKDLTRLLRESKEERGFIDAYMDERFTEQVDRIITEGLDRYKTTLESAIEEGEKAVLDRFEAMGNVLLGEDWQSRIEGKKSLPDVIAEAAAMPSFREVMGR